MKDYDYGTHYFRLLYEGGHLCAEVGNINVLPLIKFRALGDIPMINNSRVVSTSATHYHYLK